MTPVRTAPVAARAVRAGAAVLLLAAAAGCSGSGNTIADQARRGDDLGYLAGDGAVQQLAPQDRRPAVTLRGTTLDGSAWDLAAQRGKLVVVNVWGSWCQPCQAEAPHVEQAYQALRARGVGFIGIDVGEGPQTGAAAARKWQLTYPSLSDPDRVLAAGLDGLANATPSTLVIDEQGRIAARVSGAVTSAATITGLVEDASAPGSATASAPGTPASGAAAVPSGSSRAGGEDAHR